jgi:hypothetical protein
MPETTKTVTIQNMPAALWWDVRVQAAEEHISAKELIIKALRQYLGTKEDVHA